MTPPERAKLFDALAELCRRYPHWRFGQLVANVAGWADVDLWDIEDEKWQAAALSHLKDLALAEMAADADIQRETKAINEEFAVTEMDGLGKE